MWRDTILTVEEHDKILSDMRTLLTEFEYEHTDYALDKIIQKWAAEKADLIQHFKTHPNYDGNFRIRGTISLPREFDSYACGNFWQWVHGTLIDTVKPTDKYVNELALAVIREYDYRDWDFLNVNVVSTIMKLWRSNSGVLSDENAAYIEQCVPELHPHAGEKLSRITGRLCKLIGINSYKNIVETKFITESGVEVTRKKDMGYEYHFAKYADAVSPKTFERYCVLSVNPIDYWTMSFGNSWASCHTIDKINLRHSSGQSYQGCYSAGTTSYMLDPSSFVLYTSLEDESDKVWCNQKIVRQMFHWNGSSRFVQGRLYPQSNDSNKDAYEPYRAYVQKALSDMYNVENRWLLKRGTSYACDAIYTRRSCHYKDYQSYDSVTTSTLKNYEGDITDIEVGARPICIECGEEHDNETTINCCTSQGNKNIVTCYNCDTTFDIEEEGVAWGNRYYCNDCITECEHCGELVPNTDTCHVIEVSRWASNTYQEYWCSSCRANDASVCDDCDEFVSVEAAEYPNNLRDCLCPSCYEDYRVCEDCGDLEYESDIIYDDNGACHCARCFSEEEAPTRIRIRIGGR